MSQTKLRNFRK